MAEIADSANLDWVWIKFVGLWLLGALVLIVASMIALQYLRGRRHG